MADIENEIIAGIVDDLDASETPPAGTFTAGAGPGTASMNYAPGTTPRGAVAGLHESAGTRPYTGYVGLQDTPALAETIRATKLANMQSDASFRAFDRGYVEPQGFVAGLPNTMKGQDDEQP